MWPTCTSCQFCPAFYISFYYFVKEMYAYDKRNKREGSIKLQSTSWQPSSWLLRLCRNARKFYSADLASYLNDLWTSHKKRHKQRCCHSGWMQSWKWAQVGHQMLQKKTLLVGATRKRWSIHFSRVRASLSQKWIVPSEPDVAVNDIEKDGE